MLSCFWISHVCVYCFPFCFAQLNVDYAVDCILGDDDGDSDENNELPYAKDSFESPSSFPLSEMSSSPTDVSSATECMIVSCSTRGKASSSMSSPFLADECS